MTTVAKHARHARHAVLKWLLIGGAFVSAVTMTTGCSMFPEKKQPTVIQDLLLPMPMNRS